jgi:energy-coupling factor transporter ATP-binding protein EcfA2
MSEQKYINTDIQLRDYTSTLVIPKGELSMFIGRSNSGKTRAAVIAAVTIMANNEHKFEQCVFVTQDHSSEALLTILSEYRPKGKNIGLWHVADGITSMEEFNDFVKRVIPTEEITKTLFVIDTSFHLDHIEPYKGATIIKTETVPVGGSMESFFRLVILPFVVHIMSIQVTPDSRPKIMAEVRKDRWGASNQGGMNELPEADHKN